MNKPLVRRLSEGVYEMLDHNNPRFSYRFHCDQNDLDDVISMLQTKAWVTHDHVDQLKDMVSGRSGVEL